MSIDLYTGVPGSGKSLDAAGRVRFALNHGRPVVANFMLAPDAPVKHPELFTYLSNDEITADAIQDYADHFWMCSGRKFREDYILLVIDEAQLKFNSRRWHEKSRMAFLQFMSQSRKYGVKVILVAQGAKMIDNQFRMLVDREVMHRKLSTCGFLGWLLSLPFAGRLFVRVSYLYQAQERLGADWYFYRSKDAAMYDSYARFRQEQIDAAKNR